MMTTISNTRYTTGQALVDHKGVKVTTSVGSAPQDLLVKYTDRLYEFDIGYIPVGYQHRPDMISELFYNTPGYWWLLMIVNNVPDPFEGFNVGDRIKIPKL